MMNQIETCLGAGKENGGGARKSEERDGGGGAAAKQCGGDEQIGNGRWSQGRWAIDLRGNSFGRLPVVVS